MELRVLVGVGGRAGLGAINSHVYNHVPWLLVDSSHSCATFNDGGLEQDPNAIFKEIVLIVKRRT